MKLKNFLLLSLVVLLSSSIIFFQFNQVPKNLSFDEVEFGRLALSLSGKPYTPYSTLATGHSTLYFYVILLSFQIFGVGNFGLRFPSAFFGVLSVAIFYLIAQRVFKKQSPMFFVTVAVIFLSSRWFFNFARFSFEATFLLFLELASIYFFLRASNWSLILSGLFAGLAFNSYTPGRIFFLLPLGFLILQKWNRSMVIKLLSFLVPFIIVAAPLSMYLLGHQDARVDRLLFWKNREMTTSEKIEGTVQNVASLTGMFNIKGDLNGRHNYPGKPALNPILGLLFIAGLMIAVKNWKNIYNRFFAFYLILSLIPSVMVYPWENPSMLRAYTAIPAVVYFMGQTITLVKRNALQIILVALVFLSAAYEIRTYFKYQASVFDKAFEIKAPLNKIIK